MNFFSIINLKMPKPTYSQVFQLSLRGLQYEKFKQYTKCWVNLNYSEPSSTLTIETLSRAGVLSEKELHELLSCKSNDGKLAFFKMVVERYGEHLISKK